MNTADHYDQEADNFGEQARIAEETEARLAADPAVQGWLKNFWGDGGGLLAHYAGKKASYLMHGPGWLAAEESRALRPLTEANERLWEIQQKKLFNLQCEWRAGLLDLPDVATGAEFAEWGDDIPRCPLLPPISAEDVDLYRAYLLSDDCVDVGAGIIGQLRWQEYDLFRQWHRLEEAGSDSPGHDLGRALPDGLRDSFGNLFNLLFRYPEWYAYYDLYRGTGPLLRLPDERGPAPSPAVPARPEEFSTVPPEPPLRHLSATDLQLSEALIKRFESRDVLRFMRAMEFQPEQDAETEAMHGVYEELCEARDPVPVAAGPDWRECLRRAQVAHEKCTLAAALPAAYRDYCLREQAGIAHPPLG